MALDQKKVAAAMAGVTRWLEEEQEAERAGTARMPSSPSIWSQSGREQIMAMRTLLTARLWK